MKNMNEITRIVVANVGKGQLIGEQTVGDDAVKTAYEFLNHVLSVVDVGDRTFYYLNNVKLPAICLEDAVELCRNNDMKRTMFQLVEKKHFPSESRSIIDSFESFEQAMACLKDLCDHDFIDVMADYAIMFDGKELFSTNNENAR